MSGYIGKGIELPNLDTPNEWTKTQNFDATILVDATTIAWDTESNMVCKVILTANRIMGAPTNLIDGAFYSLSVIQDATGSRTLTWNAVFKWGYGLAPVLSTSGNSRDVISFQSDGTNLYEVGKNLSVS